MAFTGHDPSEPLPASWSNRKLVTAALYDVTNDFENRSETWEHETIPQYLEAMCELLMSIEHSYANNDTSLPEDPWVVMADVIRGARYYE